MRRVCIDLPNLSEDDARAYGLWLESYLRAAKEDGNMETDIGIIRISEVQR